MSKSDMSEYSPLQVCRSYVVDNAASDKELMAIAFIKQIFDEFDASAQKRLFDYIKSFYESIA